MKNPDDKIIQIQNHSQGYCRHNMWMERLHLLHIMCSTGEYFKDDQTIGTAEELAADISAIIQERTPTNSQNTLQIPKEILIPRWIGYIDTSMKWIFLIP